MGSEVAEVLRYRRSRFSTRLPRNRLYTQSHFWLESVGAGQWRVGLTQFATRMLGDLVEYEFHLQAGARMEVGGTMGWIEGFKALSDLYAVVTGEFVSHNADLATDVTLLDRDPYHGGWLYRARGTADPRSVEVREYADLLDATIDRMLAEQGSESWVNRAG